MKKLKELCSGFRQTALSHCSAVFASNIFSPQLDVAYIHTTKPVVGRFGIPVLTFENTHFPMNIEFGCTEKYVLNRIFHSDYNLLFFTGGIGCGKTSFLNYLQKIFCKRNPDCDSECTTKGFIVYINFEELTNHQFGQNENKIKKFLNKIISGKILNKILEKNLFDFEEEITGVWDWLLSDENACKNIVFEEIANELYPEDASEMRKVPPDKYDTIYRLRKKIYNNVKNDDTDFLQYQLGILGYIKEKIFNGKRHCLIILFDNLDKLPPLAQYAAQSIFRAVFYPRKSNILALVALRFVTYRGLCTQPTHESIVHGGHDLMKIVSARIDQFIRNPDFAGLEIVDDSTRKNFTDRLKEINIHLESTLIRNFYNSICGDSVRKALIISKHLIYNSVYDPFTAKEIKRGEILRALMVGRCETYKREENSVIENIYNISNYKGASLVKLRILRALAMLDNSEGSTNADMEIGALIDNLMYFGYETAEIRHALNDLLLPDKQLIWSNARISFPTDEVLISHKHSNVGITDAGIGYQKTLYKNVQYFQAVILDIHVDENIFSSNYDFTNPENKNSITLKFIKLLLDKDIEEIKKYKNSCEIDKYKLLWNEKKLITLEILDGIKQDIVTILSKTIASESNIEKKAALENTKTNLVSMFSDMEYNYDYQSNQLFNEW